MTELLVGTKKGLFALEGPPGGPFEVTARAFAGEPVEYAMHDPRTGRALAAGTGAHRAGVGARVGLGQAEAPDRLARRHPRQPLLFLLLRAPFPDREHRQRALHGDQRADPRVAGLQLQAGEPVGGRRGAGAAVALEVHAEDVQLAELLGELERDRGLLEPVADVGDDLVLDESADSVADVALFVREKRVDREEVGGVDLGGGGGGRGHDLDPSARISIDFRRSRI